MMTNPMKYIILTTAFIIPSILSAWDGYDYDSGDYVEIQGGNLVRSGLDIEIYDYDTGDYHDVEVQSIESYGSSVEVEVYDYETDEYRTLEMDQ